jgi:hypothetical protein
VEQCILRIRKNLKSKSALGEYGAVAIHREMSLQNCPAIPSIRTINRILKRYGSFDSRHRIRYKSPPRGWYLPEVVTGSAELDSFDYVEDLRLAGKHGLVHVFNGISLHGHLVCSFPFQRMTAENTVFALKQHWQEFGIPSYAQFDNATVFTGFHGVDSVGQVIRFCLSLGVTPVFAPPRETGFQASVERYNGQWQKSVWERFRFKKIIGRWLSNRRSTLMPIGTNIGQLLKQQIIDTIFPCNIRHYSTNRLKEQLFLFDERITRARSILWDINGLLMKIVRIA